MYLCLTIIKRDTGKRFFVLEGSRRRSEVGDSHVSLFPFYIFLNVLFYLFLHFVTFSGIGRE